MKVNVILHGGDSYAWPTESEVYPSLKDALKDWSDMRTFGRTRDGLYAPLWGDTSDRDDNGYATVGYAWTYDGSDIDPVGSYPDWQLLLGPRGGLRWEYVP